MKFGLTKTQCQTILDAAKKFTEIESIIVFGSRAMGNHKPESDIDLALVGKKVSQLTRNRLSGILNDEARLPIRVDVVVYNDELSAPLRDHIQNHGKPFFNKQ